MLYKRYHSNYIPMVLKYKEQIRQIDYKKSFNYVPKMN